ncbi:hypothetical protein [Bradyrhizobium cosmicum]|uniref:hypothetical protein n=1 Tax=Bradyrhizobium cosmicum TaxID=1404864 RepID=UPI0028E19280|nr:hypothetical protein [Bradyrhizobium cosmicum]
MKRHRFKQDKTIGERLIREARLAREKADQFRADDAEREAFSNKPRELDIATNIDGWLNSRGLQPPK